MQYETFWNGLFDVRWEDEPLGAEAIRLAMRLQALGYCAATRRHYGRMVIHLGEVLALRGQLDIGRLNERDTEDFVRRHLPVCSCYRGQPKKRFAYASRALGHLLAMLREEGVIPPVSAARPPYDAILENYCRFLLKDRGLAWSTVVTQRCYLRGFLEARGEAVAAAELVRLSATDLLAFAHRRGGRLGTTSWNQLASSLTGFYRWLESQGYEAGHVIGVVPPRRRYRLAGIACAISWEQVQKILAAVDRHGPSGRRNYAMLLLIATYGLRNCEVRNLKLDDIDWSHDEITISVSKTRRVRRLPLLRPVGEAILDYLCHERPVSRHREVFLSRLPPQGPICHKFYNWVARCFEKAGVDSPHRGTHTLRHSLAVHLLRRGETLKGIGDILGHCNVETTFGYTKLHLEDLRGVALEPEVVS